MPQLNEEQAREAAEAESGWEMVPDIYKVQLTAVHDANPKTKEPFIGKDSGEPFWKWEVTFPDNANGGKYKRRKLWYTTTLAQGKKGMLRKAFEAFGADTSVKTDLLLGRFCLVQVDNVPGFKNPNSMEADIVDIMPLPADDPDYKKPLTGPNAGKATGNKAAAKEDESANF